MSWKSRCQDNISWVWDHIIISLYGLFSWNPLCLYWPKYKRALSLRQPIIFKKQEKNSEKIVWKKSKFPASLNCCFDFWHTFAAHPISVLLVLCWPTKYLGVLPTVFSFMLHLLKMLMQCCRHQTWVLLCPPQDLGGNNKDIQVP